jgi:hypothetical protein
VRFNNPLAYVYRTASWMERFQVLPHAGGLDDQDSLWADDMELYFAMKAQVIREYHEWKKANAGQS